MHIALTDLRPTPDAPPPTPHAQLHLVSAPQLRLPRLRPGCGLARALVSHVLLVSAVPAETANPASQLLGPHLADVHRKCQSPKAPPSMISPAVARLQNDVSLTPSKTVLTGLGHSLAPTTHPFQRKEQHEHASEFLSSVGPASATLRRFISDSPAPGTGTHLLGGVIPCRKSRTLCC